ncbi:MAG TPA: potassium-transporting ATPase subunit KdpA [Terriglobia bacterium]|nr:potassium-transporting ATPase subunit KdpA [Terriglobia bacterium]
MTFNGLLQIAVFSVLIIALVKPMGSYMTKVFEGQRNFLSPIFVPVERLIYKICGIRENDDQHWMVYAISMLVLNFVLFASLYAILRLQAYLPLNPRGFPGMAPDLAFNTAISFVTNTNWQNYGGESTLSYFSQMVGLTVHNFISAATGIALAVAFIRGFSRKSAQGIGNFWVDTVRCTLYILLPISFIAALFLVFQGMPQNFHDYVTATTLEGGQQTIAQGPVASQIAIKMFGTNGGGFFNANAAHPYENPTALSNLIQMILIFALGAGLTNMFGRMVKDQRQGWALFAVMGVLFLAGTLVCYWAEAQGNPAYTSLPVDQLASSMQSGGNMEGKEVRFGIANSALFATVTTDASCGAVNSMHDSFTPLGGMVPLVNIMLGEVIVGGVGSGLYGMLIFAIIAVFIAGLMVGRTPEYVGKKIEAKEVKYAMLALLCVPLVVLGFAATATILPSALKSLANSGPHGFSEIMYLYVSSAGNNGSAFGGITGNTMFYNITGAITMFIGRFFIIIPSMAIAGSLAAKKLTPASAGTFPTNGTLFVGLLLGVIVIVVGLTYFPALALGPVVEHLMMLAGQQF